MAETTMARQMASLNWKRCVKTTSLGILASSAGLSLTLQYGNGESEETVADKEEVVARVRVRSVPLQGKNCSLVEVGDRILATHNSHVKGLFFDAQVEKIIRVRHSSKIHCRCTFTIKWLHRAHEGEAFSVASSGIMKLAAESIDLHPAISAFFSTMESSIGLCTSPLPNIADRMDWEVDIHALLEKQIEDINNSAKVSGRNSSVDLLFGIEFEVDLKGKTRKRAINTTKLSDLTVQGVVNHLKRTPHTTSKQAVETKPSKPSIPIPSVKEDSPEIGSLANPLAARAALASFRSEFPQSVRLSVQDILVKADIISVDSSMMDELPTKPTLTRENSKYEGIVKTLFPTASSPEVDKLSIVSSRPKLKKEENEGKNPVKKVTQQPSERRLTRLAAQRNKAVHEGTETTYAKRTNLRSSSKTSITCSTADKKDVSTKCAKSSANKIAGQKNDSSERKRPSDSPNDAKSSRPADNGERFGGNDGWPLKYDSQRDCSSRDRKT